jgi:BASS family bile acid:Na+ symporter
VTVPLAAGLAIRRVWPALAHRVVRPVEVTAEAVGAVSLVFVSVVEWRSVMQTGWGALAAMVALFEVSLAIGYAVGGPSAQGRRVIGLGTSNRNIALALLIAAGSFPGSPALAAVVANGLLMILLGLAHTGVWRLARVSPPGAGSGTAG